MTWPPPRSTLFPYTTLFRSLGHRPRLLREPVDFPLRLRGQLGDVEARLLEQGYDDAVVLGKQSEEEVRIVNDRIAARPGQCARLLQGLGRLDGQTLGSNHGCIGIVADAGSNVCAGQKCRFGRSDKDVSQTVCYVFVIRLYLTTILRVTLLPSMTSW